MTELTTEPLGDTVGATGRRRRPRPAARTTTTCPPGAWTRSRPTVSSCSRASTSTTPPRWPSAGSWATSRCSATATRPRSSGSRSIRPRTRRRPTSAARSTGTSTAAPTTSRSWRPLLSAHEVATSGGETEFASSYVGLRGPVGRREGAGRVPAGGAHHRGVAAPREPRPLAGGARRVAVASGQGAPVWCGTTARAGGRWCWERPRSHVVGWDPDESRALLDDLLERSTAPDRVYRHEWEVGDMVIWDNRGVLHRALPYDPSSRARHAPHHAGRRRVDRMTDNPDG